MNKSFATSRRDENVPERVAAGETGKRRPYAPPRLECFGKLSELTRFGGSRVVDSGTMSLGNQPP